MGWITFFQIGVLMIFGLTGAAAVAESIIKDFYKYRNKYKGL